MTVPNASSGDVYEIVLEGSRGAWTATWRTLDGGGNAVGSGPSGRIEDPDATDAFRAARDRIEEADDAVIGCDWKFEEPLPPWFFE